MNNKITIVSPGAMDENTVIPYAPDLIDKVLKYNPVDLFKSSVLKEISDKCSSDYILFSTGMGEIEFNQYGLMNFCKIASSTKAGILYSDFYVSSVKHPVSDYQDGSVRDDFEFGPLLFFRTEAFKEAVRKIDNSLKYAGLYAVRLNIAEKYKIHRIPEYLYRVFDTKSGSQFDYVNPRNRESQIEMEKVFTDYLKSIKAWLSPDDYNTLEYNADGFKVRASVIIPVKNRVNTIREAVNSALSQQTDFDFNVIVVDNHSTDGTTAVLKSIEDKRLIHIIPKRLDLGIGGCWNEAIMSESCGLFSVQLDSDDIYSGTDTLQKIINKFNSNTYGMVIGSYKLTDISLNELPPGIIDHKEWTDDNGRNNALRINGLGAPRAFYTPLIRSIKFPNVSYGEDYAAALNVSRHYKIGRIYEPIYLCRRWEGNTDSSLSQEKKNEFNYYKDKTRTYEIEARRQINAQK